MSVISISFPGILYPHSVVATSYLGIFPGIATLTCFPQAVPPASPNGNLVMSDLIGTVTWTNAHIDRTAVKMDSQGQWLKVTIADRRIWWRYTVINGLYNERSPDGQVVAQGEKSPAQLAVILLDAMGETGYDVSALPDDPSDRPLCNWSIANASVELHRLCRERGCDIALNYQTNKVSIVLLGSGASIPTDNLQTISNDVDLGEIPEILMVATGDVLFQAKFKLEALIEDLDGQLVLPEDVSYAPASYDTQEPGSVFASSLPKIRAVAERSYYHIYRIKEFSQGGLTIPTSPDAINLIDIRQCLPLHTVLATVYDDQVKGKIHLDAYVEGKFVVNKQGGVQNIGNTTQYTKVEVGFDLFPETGYVTFNSPMYRVKTGGFEPAELYLTAAFSVRNTTDRQYFRYVKYENLGGTGTEVISRPDLIRTIVLNYHPDDPRELVNLTDNKDPIIDPAADAIISNALIKYETQTTSHVQYIGIKNLVLDGITRQITWWCTRETRGRRRGANTVVGRNAEPEYGVARERERERLAQLLARAYSNTDLEDTKNALKLKGRSLP